jgi:catechol 2,3-dioxygenase-like lactoylglutathione lyase family enzyme
MDNSRTVVDRASSAVAGSAASFTRGRPMLRGVHHLALNTDDLKATLDFYVKVLGMPLIGGFLTGSEASNQAAARGNPPFNNIPHYFLNMGGDSILAFFEYPKGAVGKADRNMIAAMQHIAFACSPSRFKEIEQRLRDAGTEIIYGPMLLAPPNIYTFYFYDPNGIRMEVTSDLAGHDTELKVVNSITMPRELMRREMRKFTDDEAWIEDMLEHMVEGAPLSGIDEFAHN